MYFIVLIVYVLAGCVLAIFVLWTFYCCTWSLINMALLNIYAKLELAVNCGFSRQSKEPLSLALYPGSTSEASVDAVLKPTHALFSVRFSMLLNNLQCLMWCCGVTGTSTSQRPAFALPQQAEDLSWPQGIQELKSKCCEYYDNLQVFVRESKEIYWVRGNLVFLL